MSGKHYLLRITLKSDLCVGSGYSYAGIIDSDVCYDALGLPDIPARRLKGCLREAAEMIGLSGEETDRLFGADAQDAARGIFLGNARLEHYGEMRSELLHMGKNMRKYVTPQNVLEEFTSVRAQTKIGENGAAKDNSLRFSRIVNHYSPVGSGQEELCFAAEVELDGEKTAEMLERVAKAVRNIGLNRNRGMGSVQCRLDPVSQEPKLQKNDCSAAEDEELYVLRYRIRNTAPLILSSGNDFKTEKYISGRSVLGFFAGAYLAEGGDADSEEFASLFLKNQVIFSTLYPAEEEGSAPGQGEFLPVYYPAPFYIKRLKKTKKYVNVSKELPVQEADCEERGIETAYACGNGNQPKRLRETFCRMQGGKIRVIEPAVDIVYHHTKKSKRQNAADGELLYSLETLREQQTFAGELIGSGRAIKRLARLLERGTLRFGKSKSAQYGTCVLADVPTVEKAKNDSVTYPAGSRILVVLQSDALFLGENGWISGSREVRKQIREVLGIEESEEGYTEMETKALTGYYSKWNQKRPAVPAVLAGSTFEFRLAKEWKSSGNVVFLGEQTGEGFGRAEIVPNNGTEFRICEEADSEKIAGAHRYSAELARKILLKEAWERLMRRTASARLGFQNSASLGRIALMLDDSINAFPDDPEECYRDFRKRIASVKKAELKKKAESVLGEWICPDGELSAKELRYLHGKLPEQESEMQELEALYQQLGTVSFAEEMKKQWSCYLTALLVQEKYNLKHGEDRADD